MGKETKPTIVRAVYDLVEPATSPKDHDEDPCFICEPGLGPKQIQIVFRTNKFGSTQSMLNYFVLTRHINEEKSELGAGKMLLWF